MAAILTFYAFEAPADAVAKALPTEVLNREPRFAGTQAWLYSPRENLTLAVLDDFRVFEDKWAQQAFVVTSAGKIASAAGKALSARAWAVNLRSAATDEARAEAFAPDGSPRWSKVCDPEDDALREELERAGLPSADDPNLSDAQADAVQAFISAAFSAPIRWFNEDVGVEVVDLKAFDFTEHVGSGQDLRLPGERSADDDGLTPVVLEEGEGISRLQAAVAELPADEPVPEEEPEEQLTPEMSEALSNRLAAIEASLFSRFMKAARPPERIEGEPADDELDDADAADAFARANDVEEHAEEEVPAAAPASGMHTASAKLGAKAATKKTARASVVKNAVQAKGAARSAGRAPEAKGAAKSTGRAQGAKGAAKPVGRAQGAKGVAKPVGRAQVAKGAAKSTGRAQIAKGAVKSSGRAQIAKGAVNSSGRAQITKGAAMSAGRSQVAKGAVKGSGRSRVAKGAAKSSGRSQVAKKAAPATGAKGAVKAAGRAQVAKGPGKKNTGARATK